MVSPVYVTNVEFYVSLSNRRFVTVPVSKCSRILVGIKRRIRVISPLTNAPGFNVAVLVQRSIAYRFQHDFIVIIFLPFKNRPEYRSQDFQRQLTRLQFTSVSIVIYRWLCIFFILQSFHCARDKFWKSWSNKCAENKVEQSDLVWSFIFEEILPEFPSKRNLRRETTFIRHSRRVSVTRDHLFTTTFNICSNSTNSNYSNTTLVQDNLFDWWNGWQQAAMYVWIWLTVSMLLNVNVMCVFDRKILDISYSVQQSLNGRRCDVQRCVYVLGFLANVEHHPFLGICWT